MAALALPQLGEFVSRVIQRSIDQLNKDVNPLQVEYYRIGPIAQQLTDARKEPLQIIKIIADTIKTQGDAQIKNMGAIADKQIILHKVKLLATAVSVAIMLYSLNAYNDDLKIYLIDNLLTLISTQDPNIGGQALEQALKARVREIIREGPTMNIINKAIAQAMELSFGISGTVEEVDNSNITILESGKKKPLDDWQTFIENINNKNGVLQFSGGHQTHVVKIEEWINNQDFHAQRLHRINAYGFYKLLLYLPKKTWIEHDEGRSPAWLKGIIPTGFHYGWWESPADRFLMFLWSWAVQMLSQPKISLFSPANSLQEKINLWREKELEATPEFRTTDLVLQNMKEFANVFTLDIQTIFAKVNEVNDGQNPMVLLTNNVNAKEKRMEQTIYSFMITCAKAAKETVDLQIEKAIKDRISYFDGQPVPEGGISLVGERLDFYGVKEYIDFASKYVTKELSANSKLYYDKIDIMKQFMKYFKSFISDPDFNLSGFNRSTLPNELKQYLIGIKARLIAGVEPLDASPNMYSLRAVQEEAEQVNEAIDDPLTRATQAREATEQAMAIAIQSVQAAKAVRDAVRMEPQLARMYADVDRQYEAAKRALERPCRRAGWAPEENGGGGRGRDDGGGGRSREGGGGEGGDDGGGDENEDEDENEDGEDGEGGDEGGGGGGGGANENEDGGGWMLLQQVKQELF